MVAACSSPSPSVSTPSTTLPIAATTSTPPNASYGAGAVHCRGGNLHIAWAPSISAATGENPLSITLANTGTAPCTLDGYPTVTLLDARGIALPFVYSHSGDIMVTASAPQSVLLNPGQVAWVLINKYRCDLGDKDTVSAVAVLPPGTSARLTLSAPAEPLLGYCGSGDPGSTVVVSPLEPTLLLTEASH